MRNIMYKHNSDMTVEIAAPINPKFGIIITFKVMLIAAQIPTLKVRIFCLSIDVKSVPVIPLISLRGINKAKI